MVYLSLTKVYSYEVNEDCKPMYLALIETNRLSFKLQVLMGHLNEIVYSLWTTAAFSSDKKYPHVVAREKSI